MSPWVSSYPNSCPSRPETETVFRNRAFAGVKSMVSPDFTQMTVEESERGGMKTDRWTAEEATGQGRPGMVLLP